MAARKVTFNGLHLWAMEPDIGGDYPLAPQHHMDDNGELNENAFDGDSYAHVFPTGNIMRYLQRIGHESEIVEGWV